MAKVMILNRRTMNNMEVNLQGSPIRKMNRELNVGLQVSLTLSLTTFFRYSNERLRNQIQYWMDWLNPIINHGDRYYGTFAIILKIKVAPKNNNIQSFVSLRPWIEYSNYLHRIVLNYYMISDGFYLDTLYAIIMYQYIGRNFFRKFMEFP